MIDLRFLKEGARRLRTMAIRRANYAAAHSDTSNEERDESDFMRIFADSVLEAVAALADGDREKAT